MTSVENRCSVRVSRFLDANASKGLSCAFTCLVDIDEG
jgi:hypothetical protein